MPAFTVTADSALPPVQVWERVTDWPAHGRYVPLTTMSVTTDVPNGVGTVFTARTAVGPFGFDDPMEIVEWREPADGIAGRCRIEKRGRVILGWAELTVEARGSGSRAIWTEDATPAGLPGFARGGSAVAGRLLFGRVLRKLVAA